MEIQFNVFEHLLKAPSKDYISRLLLEAFAHREDLVFSEIVLRTISETLEIDQNASEQLLKELSALIKKVLFDGLNDLTQIQALFAQADLQANLKTLLSKLIFEKIGQFKKTLVEDQNMIPKLVDFDWRVDIKTASNLASTDDSSKSGQQTCILQLKNESLPSSSLPAVGTGAALSLNQQFKEASIPVPSLPLQTQQQQQNPKQMNRTISISKLNKPILDIYEIIKQQFAKRSEKQLGLLSFFARIYPNDKCGSNGLPLTPNSIRIYGKFQYLKSLKHNYLCRYIDIQRGQHERLFVISEHYSLNLNDLLNETYVYNLIIANTQILVKWFSQMLKAFNYLCEHSIVHRYLNLKYFCVTPNGNIKLNNYGLFYMSEHGYCVDFPIVNLATLAPECLILEYSHGNKFDECPANNNEQNIQLNNSKSDVWSFGVILFQFLFGLSTQTESSQKQLNELLVPERILSLALNLLSDINIDSDSSLDQCDDMDGGVVVVKAQDEIIDSAGYDYMLRLYEIDATRQQQLEQRIRPIFIQLMKRCLTVNPIKRPSFSTLLYQFEKLLNSSNDLGLKRTQNGSSIGQQQTNNNDDDISLEIIKWKLFDGKTRSSCLPMKTCDEEYKRLIDNSIGSSSSSSSLLPSSSNESGEDGEEQDHLWRRGVDEVYYLWRLAAGDCLQTLKQNGRLKSKLMPIHKLAVYSTVEDGYEYGRPVDDETIFDDTIVPLSLQQLRNRLSLLKTESYYPIMENLYDTSSSDPSSKQQRTLTSSGSESELKRRTNYSGSVSISSSFICNKIQTSGTDLVDSIQKQPLNIREADIEYQFHRIIRFSRYLIAYPYKKQELYKECLIDIPPIYRGLTWATLLDVRSDIHQIYAQINKEIITPTDRQIDVDIPRCHQYDPLMASPEAHYKLKRLLKAWVISNPHLVYWQGLDSLCAPFLYLNFNNESVAYGCLTNFVNKYAAKFFLKDNSFVIHEYLAVFSHLIAFHDAELANHFEMIDFKPDLYAIPWFLTMFAHVFPLYKIFHLWDTLLLGSSSFPLCIGISILKQLRTLLLNSDFNECILLFSELPEINIAKCVTDTIEIFSWTPSSCLYRQHSVFSPLIKDLIVEDPDLDMSPITLDQMRNQMCPRISVRDILKLYDVNLSKLVLIDIRPAAEYAQSYVVNSKNIPFESINFNKLNQLMQTQISSANENDPTVYLAYLMQQYKNLLKIIISSQARFNNSVELTNNLIRLNINRVCILNKGVECFRSTKIFIQLQQQQ